MAASEVTAVNGISYEATVVNGQIRLPENVHLPENLKVLVVVPREAASPSARMASPRLVYPEQAAQFQMNVQDIADAGV